MTLDAHIWEGICLAILIALIYKPVKNFLVDALDGYSDKVKEKIDDAENLCEEAEKTFNYYQKQHKEFLKTIESTERRTRDNIKSLKENAATKLKEQMDTKLKIHEERIWLFEEEETKKIKETIVKKAARLTEVYVEEVIRPSLTKKEITELMDSVGEQPITFH